MCSKSVFNLLLRLAENRCTNRSIQRLYNELFLDCNAFEFY